MNNRERPNPKIIGLLCAWGAEDWIHPAIKQALELCDEVHVAVLPHSEEIQRFEDKSLEIARKFTEINLYSDPLLISTHSEAKAKLLNHMLAQSRYYKVGNWIWIMDVDEFYEESTITEIKEIVFRGEFDTIDISSRFFFINMQHYLKSVHGRLFKIKPVNLIPYRKFRFRPTQNWFNKLPKVYQTSWGHPMFHYSFLTNSNQRLIQWKTEYPSDNQNEKIRWLNEIYRKFDLNDQKTWIEKNYQFSGYRSPWLGPGLETNSNGELFKYNGTHPRFIEESELPEIGDFRKYYGFV